jgi:hypothetical protein
MHMRWKHKTAGYDRKYHLISVVLRPLLSYRRIDPQPCNRLGSPYKVAAPASRSFRNG